MRNIECEICGKFLKNEKGLKRHMTEQHTGFDEYFNFYGYKVNENKGKYQCPLCDNIPYSTPGSLRSHMNTKHTKQLIKKGKQ